MPLVSLSPAPILRFVGNDNLPLVGGMLYTYQAGTNVPYPTYTDSTGQFQHQNPIILNTRGEVAVASGNSAGLWIPSGTSYLFVLQDAQGNQIWSLNNISDGSAQLLSLLTSNVVAGALNSLELQAAERAAGVTPADLSYPPLNILRYGADPAGAVSSRSALLSAITVASQLGGGVVVVPSGNYLCEDKVPLAQNITIQGQGKFASVINFTHTGDGFTTTSPINSSSSVNVALRDIGISNSNASNAGGGYVDVGGTYIELSAFRVTGFAYGAILDQSELADITLCDFEFQAKGGVWLVNGADHTPLAAQDYTNRIKIESCQFNNNTTGTAVGIIDDGGHCHTFTDNNFSGFATHIRSAGGANISILNGEFEAYIVTGKQIGRASCRERV